MVNMSVYLPTCHGSTNIVGPKIGIRYHDRKLRPRNYVGKKHEQMFTSNLFIKTFYKLDWAKLDKQFEFAQTKQVLILSIFVHNGGT